MYTALKGMFLFGPWWIVPASHSMLFSSTMMTSSNFSFWNVSVLRISRLKRYKSHYKMFHDISIYGGFQKLGIPPNGCFTMENPIKMDDLGIPLFSETVNLLHWFANDHVGIMHHCSAKAMKIRQWSLNWDPLSLWHGKGWKFSFWVFVFFFPILMSFLCCFSEQHVFLYIFKCLVDISTSDLETSTKFCR